MQYVNLRIIAQYAGLRIMNMYCARRLSGMVRTVPHYAAIGALLSVAPPHAITSLVPLGPPLTDTGGRGRKVLGGTQGPDCGSGERASV